MEKKNKHKDQYLDIELIPTEHETLLDRLMENKKGRENYWNESETSQSEERDDKDEVSAHLLSSESKK